MSELRIYGLRLRVRLLNVMLLRMFATGHLIRRRKSVRLSTGS